MLMDHWYMYALTFCIIVCKCVGCYWYCWTTDGNHSINTRRGGSLKQCKRQLPPRTHTHTHNFRRGTELQLMMSNQRMEAIWLWSSTSDFRNRSISNERFSRCSDRVYFFDAVLIYRSLHVFVFTCVFEQFFLTWKCVCVCMWCL